MNKTEKRDELVGVLDTKIIEREKIIEGTKARNISQLASEEAELETLKLQRDALKDFKIK